MPITPGAARALLCGGTLALLVTACSAPTGADDAATTDGAPTSPTAGASPTVGPEDSPTGAEATTSPTSPTSSPAAGPEGDGEKSAADLARETQDAVEAGTLTVPESGDGTTTPVDLPGRDTAGDGRVVRYTLEVEGGVEEVAVGLPGIVREVLTDERGWQTRDGVRFVHVSAAEREQGADADIRLLFGSPAFVDRECAPLVTNGRLSCHNQGRVMINAWRWVHGSPTYGDDLEQYRVYLINHEVGHALGHGHVPCPGQGEDAPVMLQQTLRLDGCSPYPYPESR